MPGQSNWETVADELGKVVEALLAEFAEMCRGSEHESKPLAALMDLRDLREAF
jgi:hypothetical protein